MPKAPNELPESQVSPDPKQERRTRRRFTTEYKLQIIAEVDQCQRGEVGHLLRREGLYSSQINQWRRERADEREKARLRSIVEHPFHVLKNLFGYRKVRYRGLKKKTTQLHSLFALANLYRARRWGLLQQG